ncbi:MAG: DNA polymerase I [Eubacterium sp.]|nr:DNA polymerase I [Eubacterium sp.]
MNGKFIIIDGNSLMNRAYYAMQRPMITREGIYTQGIFGFLNMLNKLEQDEQPEYIAVAWDRKSPTFRHEEYKEYKAGRRKMPPELAMEFPLIKDILSAMNIKQLEIDGFEADDIIGTLAKDSEEKGLSPLVVTGDKDALQLASDRTRIMITRKGITEFDLYDRETMLERYELTPEQFIDLKGLMGDQSDNIPGIPGVGEKTGIKLLKEFGSVAELLARSEEIKPEKLRQKVEENASLAAMSRRLATIITNVPIEYEYEDMRVRQPDVDRLVDLYSRLELNSFLKKLDTGASGSGGTAADDGRSAISTMQITAEKLGSLDIQDGSEIWLKVFGNNDHLNEPVIDGYSILIGDTCMYLKSDGEETDKAVVGFLSDRKLMICGHSLSSDAYMLLKKGLPDFRAGYDSELAAYMLDPSKSSYDIKILSLEELRHEMESDREFSKKVSQTDMLGGCDKEYMERGADILWASRALSEIQKPKIKSFGMEDIYRDLELPLIEVLASMEARGVYVDKSMLTEIGQDLSQEAERLEHAIYELAGEEFNINSTRQLGDILFEKLGLPAGKKTKTGYSTSADILEKIQDKHPIIALILQYRTITKLYSTYVEGLKPLIGNDGKIHCHYQQTVAATGRLSCTEPNLQNIPVRQEQGRLLRKAFVAGEGNVFVGADYSQIELRLMAHLSGDENLISAFNNEEDIHRKTASRVFNIPYDQVTKEDRSRAKAVNFGIIYGMSGFGLSQDIHVSRSEAERYIQEYFDKHPKVKSYLDDSVRSAKANTYSETLLGRRRYIPEITSSNYMVRQLGERLAMNSPIQGSAADIIKIAMRDVFRELKDRKLKSALVLQIHDELIIETAEDEKAVVEELLKRNMEHAMELSVKLTVDMNSAYSWYDLK